VYILEELKAQKQYLSRPEKATKFMNDRHSKTLGESTITSILAKNRVNNGLYARAHKFQRESVKKWKGKQRPAKLLTLPLSFDDETRTEECGNVLLLFLERSGIIEVRGSDADSIKISDNYETKWQLTVGDGLSQMRMRQYSEAVDAGNDKSLDDSW
jgi:hypothetical protein